MSKLAITSWLQHESKNLGSLLQKFNRLKIWNAWLKECLPEEDTLLQHCQIVGLDRMSLIVIADNAHWVTRFRCFIPDLLNLLRRYNDFKQIKAICCKVRPLHYRPTQPKRQALVISTQTAKMVDEAAEKIKHVKLKAVLKRMADRNR